MRRRSDHPENPSKRKPLWPLELGSASIQWMQRLARRYGGEQDADDIAQRAILRVVALSDPVTVRHHRAYLATIARNLTVDAARQVRARGGPALALDDLDRASQPWTAPDQETTLLLKQVILGLPPLYRDVFILNRFVGLTYQEIASRQGVTAKAIEYRMSRALALCEAALRD